MASIYISFLVVLGLQAALSFRIEISPKRYTEVSTGPVRIGCVIETLDECVNKGVVMLELHKNGEDLVASVNQRSGYRHGGDFPAKKMQGQGSVNNHHNNRSFLNVSILTPDNEDSGIYTCSLHYFDEVGDLKEDHVSKNLTVEIVNVHTVLRTLVKAVSSLENKLEAKDNEIADLKEKYQNHSSDFERKDIEIADLKEKYQNHSLYLDRKDIELVELKEKYQNHSVQMMDLVRKDSLERVVSNLQEQAQNQSDIIADLYDIGQFTTAFSAGVKSDVNFGVGSVVVFDDVTMNQRKDYDDKTGIFTVPRDGLYAFTLTTRSHSDGYSTGLHIKANDVVLAGVWAGDSSIPDQSSTSCVQYLVKGDQVKVVVWSGAELSASEKTTLFTGYSVQVF